MDSPEEQPFNNRARRAVPLIAAALTVAVVAGLLYLRPSLPAAQAPLPRPSPTPPILEQRYEVNYDFVTASTGWALVYDQITEPSPYWVLNTTDGGRHWKVQTSDSANVSGDFQIKFFNSREGYYAFVGNRAYRTADGGRRWTEITLPSAALGEVWFVDPSHGWYRSDSDFESTADGGLTWRSLPPPPVVGSLMEFRDGSVGWLASIADDGPSFVYSTHDGGASWRSHELPTVIAGGKPYRPAEGLDLLPGGGVLVILLDETAFTSFDDGSTWRSVPAPPGGNSYLDLTFQDATHWWVMRNGDLFKSTDAGQSWTHVALQLDTFDYLIQVLDPRHAWAKLQSTGPLLAGSGLAFTSDGGVHWTYANVPRPA